MPADMCCTFAAVAIRFESMASRLEAIATRLEAIAITWRSKAALFSITVAGGIFSDKVSQWYFLLMVGVWHLFP